jgi:isopentenyl diphosphate isomerase/L-lactate dehydrogenase-like FMN-dependent dehydrogenase
MPEQISWETTPPPRGAIFLTVEDYEAVAREALPPDVYDYFAGGAGDEWTLRENRAAFDRWVLRPRVLANASRPDPSTAVLGADLSFPVLVAPWAYQSLAHPDGELATARAAHRAGTVMVVSSTALDRLEEIARVSAGPKWWQLYIFVDREVTAEMLHRAHDAGYGAICFTVDFPVAGLRHRDVRSGFWGRLGVPGIGHDFDPEISWDDLEWIRGHAPLPLLVKGIMTAEDARIAVEAGADGIVVSNHGGRQLAGVAAPVTVLSEVVEAVGGRVPVLLDGGIRRGTDVFRCLALGASAVLIGKAAAFGLAAAGEEGVLGVLSILRAELDNAMALAGCRRIAEVTRSFVAPA